MTTGGKVKLWGIIVFVFLLGAFYLPRAYRGTIEVQILDKEENVYDREGTSVREYLIYTDYNDNEVFQNVNDFFYFKSHSSDLYDQIRVGEHYRISISGWKMQLFSKERNIISIERIVDHVQGQEMKEETSVPIKTEIEKVEKDTLSVDDFLEEIDAEPIEESTDSVSTPIIDL